MSKPMYYGYAIDGKPTLFPAFDPYDETHSYVVCNQGRRWFTLRPNGEETNLAGNWSSPVKDGSWVPFEKNPFE